MDARTIERFRDRLAARLHGLTDFLYGSPRSVVQLRLGPADEQAAAEELALLRTAVQKAEEKTLGVCEVCHDYVEAARLEMDYTACICLDHLSAEERRVLENDLALSQKVQQALLPQVLPSIPSVDIAAYSQPARIVGGDYFDFLRFGDGTHAVMIADVMGKGMPASMLAASLQASLRIIAPESSEPAEVVSRLNHLFCHNVHLTNFVTLFLAKIDVAARTLTYCNAGHNPPLVARVDTTIESLDPTGAAVGLVKQSRFEQEVVELRVGDMVLLYTDGVVESQDRGGEFFGDDRLKEVLRSPSHRTAQGVITQLKDALHGFSGTGVPSDDTTFIALRFTD